MPTMFTRMKSEIMIAMVAVLDLPDLPSFCDAPALLPVPSSFAFASSTALLALRVPSSAAPVVYPPESSLSASLPVAATIPAVPVVSPVPCNAVAAGTVDVAVVAVVELAKVVTVVVAVVVIGVVVVVVVVVEVEVGVDVVVVVVVVKQPFASAGTANPARSGLYPFGAVNESPTINVRAAYVRACGYSAALPGASVLEKNLT